MKRVFAAITLSILLLQPARAQESMEIELEAPAPAVPKNAIDFSMSFGSGLQIMSYYAGGLISLLGSVISNNTFIVIPIAIPGPSVEYERWVDDKIAVGAGLSADVVSALPYLVVGNIGIMPFVKYKWLDNGNIRIYSKAAAGYVKNLAGTINDDKFEFIDIQRDLFAEMQQGPQAFTAYSWVLPVIGLQFSPLCFEIPMSRLNQCFFIELGMGTKGECTFGIKKAF